ncbi:MULTISPECIES: hypothetical protein [unclassified Marinovum]|uniref:hypothetical protein n=1 Tax=unclassified Marinovum TaxID=2647166 RepID=UPI003EDB6E1D
MNISAAGLSDWRRLKRYGEKDRMQLNLQNVSIVHTIATHRLEAYYGGVLLWSTPIEEPGSEGEATEFYTATVIALVNMWEGMSNHARMALVAVGNSYDADDYFSECPFLGAYCAT